MLFQPNPSVSLYLRHASRAREAAQLAANKGDREFHERMEATWMNLAASTAWVERVDLFLQSLQSEQMPCVVCDTCQTAMTVETIEAAHHIEHYTFRCRCGATEERTVVR